MTSPHQHPHGTPSGASAGDPPDDRRDDPPLPAAEGVERNAPATEAEREALETVRSISRLEESN
jgi:hypothetical protein